MELLLESVGRKVPAQQGAIGYDSLPMVDKGYTVNPSRGIEAEYHIYALVVQSFEELRPG